MNAEAGIRLPLCEQLGRRHDPASEGHTFSMTIVRRRYSAAPTQDAQAAPR